MSESLVSGSAWHMHRPAHVVCVGNELARDDGAGIRVGRVLRELALPSCVSVEFYQGVGFWLAELIASGRRTILVDAVTFGDAPGTCRLLALKEIVELSAAVPCGHMLGIPELVSIAGIIAQGKQQANVCLVGIEAVEVSGFEARLSPAVECAVPRAVELVLGLLGAPADIVEAARAVARQMPSELPIEALRTV